MTGEVPAGPAPEALAAVPTVAPPRHAPSGGGAAFAAFAAVLLVTLVLANAVLGRLALPEYGVWTGVIPVEQKLRLLDEFAREGPVDAVVLSSSLGDQGLSAVALSEERSRTRGERWRAFNFSSGAADISACVLLYRLARTVARPREVFLAMPADPSIGEAPSPVGPEPFLTQAPVGPALRHPHALLLSRWFWSLPLVHAAAPARDYALNWRFPDTQVYYALSHHGDTLNYGLQALTVPGGFDKARIAREERLAECRKLYAQAPTAEARRRVFLSDRTVAALDELASLAHEDGGRLVLVAHDSAPGLASTDPLYRETRKLYDHEWSRATGGLEVVDFLDSFAPLPHEVADTMHLNVDGARRFARTLAARLDGRPDPEVPRRERPRIDRIDPRDPTFNALSAVVVMEGQTPDRSLELRLTPSGAASLAVGTTVHVVLRQPDDSDLALRTRVVARGLISCDATPVPAGDRVFVARVVSPVDGRAIRLPLAEYRWSPETFPSDSIGPGDATLRASVMRARPGEQVRASWSGVRRARAEDWLSVFATEGPEEALTAPVATRGRSNGSAGLFIPSLTPPGRYELRLFAAGGWNRLATSAPIEVVPSTAAVEPVGESYRAGGLLTVAWKDVVSPAKDDWIGLYAAGQPDGSPYEARVPFVFTRGGVSGVGRLEVPAATPPGLYELRLFSRTRGDRVASSPPFHLGPPAPR
jgi:hypothetical protein